MRNFKRKFVGCFFILAALWICLPAQALKVTNNGTTIFSTDYESYSINSPPPSPWVTSPDDPGSNVNKVIAAEQVSPGVWVYPYRGNKMLWERRYLNGWDRVGWAEAVFTLQSTGTLTAEFAFYIPSAGLTSNAGAYLAFKSSETGEAAWKSEVALMADGTVWNYGSGWALQNTGLTYNLDSWNTMTMSYNIATGTTALTINGITATGLWSVLGAGVTIDRVYLGTGGSDSRIFYDDAGEVGTTEPLLQFAADAAPSVYWDRTSTTVQFRYAADMLLTKIHTYVWNNTGAGTGTMKLYFGEGSSGPLLATSTTAWGDTMDYAFGDVSLTGGQWYTVHYYPESGNYGDPRMFNTNHLWRSSRIPEHSYASSHGPDVGIYEFAVHGRNAGTQAWADHVETAYLWSGAGAVALLCDPCAPRDGMTSLGVTVAATGMADWYRSLLNGRDWTGYEGLHVWVKRSAAWGDDIYFNYINGGTGEYVTGNEHIAVARISEADVPLNTWTEMLLPFDELDAGGAVVTSYPRYNVRQLHFWCDGSLMGSQNIKFDGLYVQPTPTSCDEVRQLGWTMAADLNKNCRIDFGDFAMLASNWFKCNDPNNPSDPTCKDRQDWP